MEGTKMVDVLHYYFEEDILASTSQEAVEAKSALRKEVYNLYGVPYKYEYKSSNKKYNSTASGDYFPEEGFYGEQEEDLVPFTPERKPYTPPTEFNPDSPMPFGKTLDAPLN